MRKCECRITDNYGEGIFEGSRVVYNMSGALVTGTVTSIVPRKHGSEFWERRGVMHWHTFKILLDIRGLDKAVRLRGPMPEHTSTVKHPASIKVIGPKRT